MSRLATIISTLSLFTACLGSLNAQQAGGIKVDVQQQPLPNGQVLYRYRVDNHSDRAVVSLIVGYDYGNGIPQLTSQPVGWSFDTGLQAGSVGSPPGWTSVLVTTEEHAQVQLEWKSSGPSGDIDPLTSKTGFSVTVPAADQTFTSSQWTVYLDNATAMSGNLMRAN